MSCRQILASISIQSSSIFWYHRWHWENSSLYICNYNLVNWRSFFFLLFLFLLIHSIPFLFHLTYTYTGSAIGTSLNLKQKKKEKKKAKQWASVLFTQPFLQYTIIFFHFHFVQNRNSHMSITVFKINSSQQ